MGADEYKLLLAGLTLSSVKNRIKQLMDQELQNGEFIFVSGRSPKRGIDTISEEIADQLSIKKEIELPICTMYGYSSGGIIFHPSFVELEPRHYWNYHFKPRNIKIAQAIPKYEPLHNGILYVLSPKCGQCYGEGHGDEVYSGDEGTNSWVPCSKCKGSGRIWNGGEWAGNYAEKLGKKVVRIGL